MALLGSVTKKGIMITLSMNPTTDYIPFSPTRLTISVEVMNPAGNGYSISNPFLLFDTGDSSRNRAWDLISPFFAGDVGSWDGPVAPINPGVLRQGSYATTLPASFYENIKKATICVKASVENISTSEIVLETLFVNSFTDVYLDSLAAHTPELSEFTVKRCDASGNLSDEGQYIRNVIKGAIAPRTGLLPSNHTLLVGYRLQGSTGAYTWINKTGFPAAINIDEKLDTGAVFAPGSAYEIRCELINNQRSITAHATAVLPKAFANFHLSGSGYGVGIGQYSTATEENPKFECAYPIIGYDGFFNGDGKELIPPVDYSTSRVDTGLKWTDGSPVYRKVLTFTSMAVSTSKNVSLGETAIAEVVDLRGMFKPVGETARAPIPWAHYSSAANQFQMVLYGMGSNPYITLRTGSGQKCDSGFVVIEYTLPT